MTSHKDNITYVIENNHATLTNYHTSDKNVVIPDEIDGYPVEVISAGAFEANMSITSVKMPAHLRIIEPRAFLNCFHLRTIEMDSLVSLGEMALKGTDIRKIDLPANFQKLDDAAFAGTPLESFHVHPDNKNFTSIDGVLYDRKATTLLEFPPGKYGDSEFSYRPASTTVKIGRGAFAFTDINKICLPEGLLYIDESAFFSCGLLDDVCLPDGLRSIGEEAFFCSGLSYIDIPATVEHIGENALSCCPLKSIEVDPNNRHYRSISGVLFNKDATELIQYPVHDAKRTRYEIPPTVKRIQSMAFDRALVSDVVFNEGLETIEDGAFESSKLTRVSLPSTLKEVKELAFSCCSNLTALKAPSRLKLMGENILCRCNRLERLDVHEDNFEEWQEQVPEGFTNICTE